MMWNRGEGEAAWSQPRPHSRARERHSAVLTDIDATLAFAERAA